MKIKILSFLIISILLSSFPCLASSQISVSLNGKTIEFDTPPTIIEGRTVVPLRAIFEALNITVNWDSETQTVTGIKNDKTIMLKIGDKMSKVNNKPTELDVPATIIDGRTMVLVRFIASSLGLKVDWDNETQTVILKNIVTFADSNLEKAIREELEKPQGDIDENDLSKIKSLHVNKSKINKLDGIENFKSLTKLSLSENDITDISPLKDLTNLTVLDISLNRISDIKPISTLTKLQSLNLYGNPILTISPLKNLTGITEFKLYDYEENTPLDQAILGKFDDMEKKIDEIVSKVIKPEMSELEKEIALHDYIITHVKYDKESYVNTKSAPFIHSPYGALVDGLAVCDGYSLAMALLLNKVGIEATTVFGEGFNFSSRPGGHAWNIVKINGNYYHLDLTYDDPSTKDGEKVLSHNYFNISDRQISIDHKWDKENYPQCTTDSKYFDTISNKYNNTIFTNDFNYIISDGFIYQINNETYFGKKLLEDKVYEIVLYKNYIYFVSSEDDYLYKIKLDGTGMEMVLGKKVSCIKVYADKIYFINDSKNISSFDLTISSIKTKPITYDENVCSFEIHNDMIYYKYILGHIGHIRKTDLFGKTRLEVTTANPGEFYSYTTEKNYNTKTYNITYNHSKFEIYTKDFIYYIDSSNNCNVYSIELSKNTKLNILKEKCKARSLELFNL